MLQRVRRMTVTMRLLHWALAVSVLSCFLTGLYIATPVGLRGSGHGPSLGMLMGDVRFIHFVFAMVLDVAFLVWFYLFFYSREVPFVRNLFPVALRAREAWQMLCHYFTLRNKPSTRTHTDPLNAYGFIVMHFLVLVQMITGFSLMRPIFSHANSTFGLWLWILKISDEVCLWLLGTTVVVRQVHHLVAFLTLALAFCHIYVQVWRETFWTEGHVSVVVSGYKYIEKENEG